MRKVIIALVAVGMLAGCGSAKTATSPVPSATAMSPEMDVPASSDTPLPTDSAVASPIPTVSQTASAGGLVVGPATIGGKLGSEPTVKIDVTKTPSPTLIIKDVKVGTGKSVGAHSTVTAHYVGYGAMSGKEFDSSWARNEAATFPLDNVIVGWQKGLVGMKEGGRRVLVIPASQAYGDSPPDGSGIAVGEALVFVVDLQSVQ